VSAPQAMLFHTHLCWSTALLKLFHLNKKEGQCEQQVKITQGAKEFKSAMSGRMSRKGKRVIIIRSCGFALKTLVLDPSVDVLLKCLERNFHGGK
jgi:hypothetical protein